MLVLGIQQSDSFIHTNMSIFFRFFSLYRLLQNIEYSSLCYTGGPYLLSILYIVVCICQSQTPNLSLLLLSPGNHKFAFYIHDSTSVL